MPEDRRLAAIMFTDIVGYTALMGSDEDRAFKTLRKNRNIQRPIIKKYRGEWLKEMGDGILASFSTASDAVRCAGEIQSAAKKAGISLRIGIHEGEVVFEGGDVLGDGVNIASRLEEMADEGCINISGAVYKDIKNKAGINTEFIEEKTLKNVEEPVKVYKVHCKEEDRKEELTKGEESQKARNKLPYYIIVGFIVVIAVILIWQFLPTKDTDPQTTEVTTEVVDKSIAVLPFRNDSPDQENEYFCNGMMEELLTHLQKITDLNVKSRTSVEQYRDPQKDLKIIAKELEVAFIVEGSVRKVGDNLRITTQLIDAISGDHLWAETYDGKYTDEIFEFQSNTAKKVAASLQAVITPFEEKRIDQKPTTEMLAYDLVTRGNEMLRTWRFSRDSSNLKIALNLINQALEVDPEYISAIYLKANIYMQVGNYDSVIYYNNKLIELDPDESNDYSQNSQMGILYMSYLDKPDSAFKYLVKAMDLDPNNCWKNLALGQFYFFCRNDIIKALPYYQRAYELDGESFPEINANIAFIYRSIGDYPKAEKYFKNALTLRLECSLITWNDQLLYYQGRYDEALHFLDSICGITTCAQICDIERFQIYTYKKEFEQAEKYYIKSIDDGYRLSAFDYISIAYIYKETGRENEDLALLEKSIQRDDNTLIAAASRRMWLSLTNIYLAAAYAILDENEEALRYLLESEKLGFYSGWQDLIGIFPAFENLWDDPEFKAIVKRAQDEKAAIRAQIREMEERGELDL